MAEVPCGKKPKVALPHDGDNLRQPQNKPANGSLMMPVNPESARSAETQNSARQSTSPCPYPGKHLQFHDFLLVRPFYPQGLAAVLDSGPVRVDYLAPLSENN